MLKAELKYCTKCEEVFEATVDPEQDVDELHCPYLDCDGEGTVVQADLADRFDQWMYGKHKTYLYVRGKVKVAVKNMYWRPIRKYNAVKRKLAKLFSSDRDKIDVDDLTEEQKEELLDEVTETSHVDNPFMESETTEYEVCPNCKQPDPEELTKQEGEFRCEKCIRGGFN